MSSNDQLAQYQIIEFYLRINWEPYLLFHIPDPILLLAVLAEQAQVLCSCPAQSLKKLKKRHSYCIIVSSKLQMNNYIPISMKTSSIFQFLKILPSDREEYISCILTPEISVMELKDLLLFIRKHG